MATATPNQVMDSALPEPGSIRWLIQQTLRDRDAVIENIFAKPGCFRLLGNLLLVNGGLLFAYGLTMGVSSGAAQAMSSAVKLPMLYILSLLICLPALHVINVLMGSKLGFMQTLTMLLGTLSLNSIFIISFAPITLFFLITGADYHFLKLLNVAVLALGALLAMAALHKSLGAMCEKSDIYPRHAVRILLVWMLVFGFVGTQMAWTLRPYLGAPGLDFELFRAGGNGNFYQAILYSIQKL